MIIDTHIHIWDLTRSEYKWLETAAQPLRKNYDLDMLAAGRADAGIDVGLLVQADNTLEDTSLMIEVANKYDWIQGVVGWLPLADPGRTERLLNTVVSTEKYFKGVRHLIHDEPDDEWLLQPQVIESLKLLAAYSLSYDVVGVKVSHIKTAIKVAERVPGLKMVFDHLNQPPAGREAHLGEWGQWMKEAAQHQNFFVKISGLSTVAGKENFTVENIAPCIEFVLSEFGTKRCFCGGDWPVSLLSKDYASTWNIYRQVIAGIVEDKKQQEAIFSGNAIAFYNLV